jgi:hypothetical protein
MNGSEKQVKWAMEIQAAMISDCKNRIEKMTARLNDPDYDPGFDGSRDKIEAGIEYMNATISDINAIDSASWFIDRRNDSVESWAFILFDADYIELTPYRGPVTSYRVAVIKKYQTTKTRFAKR